MYPVPQTMLHLFPAAPIITTHFVVGVKRLRNTQIISSFGLCRHNTILVFGKQKNYTDVIIYAGRVKSDVINVFLLALSRPLSLSAWTASAACTRHVTCIYIYTYIQNVQYIIYNMYVCTVYIMRAPYSNRERNPRYSGLVFMPKSTFSAKLHPSLSNNTVNSQTSWSYVTHIQCLNL